MFGLIDCNNFYASCERIFRPELNGKPIVVLSNNDGCVIARSNEAKALGVPMGAPAFEYDKFFKKNKVYVFSANFPLYGDMSRRVMTILEDYSPEIEIYSIDEAFIKMKGFEHFNLQDHGNQMRAQVLKWTGIPTSIGLAPTKSLAKVANRIAKKFPDKTGGVYIIETEQQIHKALKWLKVEDIWGIGRQHTKRLNAVGVKTAFDFIQLEQDWVKKHLSIVGLRLQMDLKGIPVLDLEMIQAKKNIATTRSFERDYTTKDELTERIATFAVSCSEKLRQQGSCCNSLMVFIQTNRFKKHLPQYGRNIVVKLPFPTNSAIELVKYAQLALFKIFRAGLSYKKAGVIVQDITPQKYQQTTLFNANNQKHNPLMKAIDEINQQYGQQKIRLASQDLKRVWKMKQEKLSPRYTTKLSDIINIKC